MTFKIGDCRVDGCGRTGVRIARGMCMTHYDRWRKYGDPLGGGTFKGQPRAYLDQLLIDHVAKVECIIWPFARLSNGYASAHLDGKTRIVSRVVCARRHGPPPTPDHQALHSCGRGADGCVNPMHLGWGVQSDNEADKIRHGTSNRGRAGAVLVEAQVREIKRLLPHKTNAQIGSRFGVHAGVINHIRTGNTWAWVQSDTQGCAA